MIWIEKFCNWVHNTGLPNSQEKLKSELVPASETRRARIQIELVNSNTNLRNTHITTIKVTNENITLFFIWNCDCIVVVVFFYSMLSSGKLS